MVKVPRNYHVGEGGIGWLMVYDIWGFRLSDGELSGGSDDELPDVRWRLNCLSHVHVALV